MSKKCLDCGDYLDKNCLNALCDECMFRGKMSGDSSWVLTGIFVTVGVVIWLIGG